MTIEEIRKGKPIGATHYSDDGAIEYIKHEDGEFYLYLDFMDKYATNSLPICDVLMLIGIGIVKPL